jgi:hypothetical protein
MNARIDKSNVIPAYEFVQRCNRLYADHPTKALNWQSAFARRIGFNDRTVRRWIAGDADVPPWVTKFLEMLERHPEEILK